jgi:hydroxymethylpyrimidine pyrophosphatase-like HAD family hydrolase
MKILGSDLDGTFSHGGVGEAKCAAVHAWRAAGHKFGIISGRGNDYVHEIRRIYPNLELDFFAACSGAYITDGDGNVLHEVRCTSVDVPKFAADLSAWGCKFINFCGEHYACIVAKAEDLPYWIKPESMVLLPDVPAKTYFYQISVAFPTPEEAAVLVEKVREVYGEWLNPLQNGTCIDIVPRGVDKAKGMYFVMDLFGGTYEDVIVVGDNVNDADMIREFRSYAMANGVPAIKEMAHAIVEDVTDLLKREM